MSNVISYEHAVNGAIERIIIDNLSNRGGKWVAEGFLAYIANSTDNPNLPIMEVINEMVNNGTLEKSFVPLRDKFDRILQAPLYRLAPEPW